MTFDESIKVKGNVEEAQNAILQELLLFPSDFLVDPWIGLKPRTAFNGILHTHLSYYFKLHDYLLASGVLGIPQCMCWLDCMMASNEHSFP